MASIQYMNLQHINMGQRGIREDFLESANSVFASLPPCTIQEIILNQEDLQQKIDCLPDQSEPMPDIISQAGILQPQSKAKRYKIATNTVRDQLKQIIENLDGKPNWKDIAEVLGIGERNCRLLGRKIITNQNWKRSTAKRGPKQKYGEKQFQQIRDLLHVKPHITDEEIAGAILDDDGNHLTISRSTIQRIRTDGSLDVDEPGVPKKTTHHQKNTNSPHNIELRVQRLSIFQSWISQGYVPVFIGETRWRINRKRKRDMIPGMDTPLDGSADRSYRLMTIAAIAPIGVLQSMLVENSPIDSEIFEAYFKCLVTSLIGEHVVFFIDDAVTHIEDNLLRIISSTPHKLVINAPGSNKLNPIELIFSHWKDRVNERIDNPSPQASLVKIIDEEWYSMSRFAAYSAIQTINSTILPKAIVGQPI